MEGPIDAPFAYDRSALQERHRSDHRVPADPDIDIDVRGVRVDHRDAVVQVVCVDPAADHALDGGQPVARVHAERPAGIDGDHRHALALVHEDRQHLVQVVLALAVLATHGRQRAEEVGATEHHDERRDQVAGTERRGRVGALHDRDQPAPFVHHARVAARLIELGREDRSGALGSPMRGEQSLQILCGHRVEVAPDHQHVLRAPHRLLRGEHRMPRSELLGLLDEDRRGLESPRPHRRTNVVGAVAHDHHDLVRRGGEHALEYMPQRRPAADGMQDLGLRGLQPFALAGREHHCGERSGVLRVLGQPRVQRSKGLHVPGCRRRWQTGHGGWQAGSRSGGRNRTSISGSKGPRLAVRRPRTAR